MLYRPPRPKKMWDCIVYYEAPCYHIFYLSSGNIGHISTEDFVHYKEFPDINGFGENRQRQHARRLYRRRMGSLQKVPHVRRQKQNFFGNRESRRRI